MNKVRRPGKNAKIAVVSPSWAGPASFPSVYELGIKNLKEKFDFDIKEYATTRKDAEYAHAHPEERARDLASAFNDSEVEGIICTIGGDDSVRLLKYLDEYTIPPKFFMGYSDSTVLLHYFNQKGFCTFYGPSVMAGFAYNPESNQEFTDHVSSFIKKWETFEYTPYTKWTNRLLDWEKPEPSLPIPFMNTTGWRVSYEGDQKEINGTLWGGSIEALEFIKGTKYWPGSELFWKDKIVFFENSDEGITESQIKWILRNYGVQGVFNDAQALLIGRYPSLDEEQSKKMDVMIKDLVREEFGSTIPIITNMDFGHTYPQQILPIGSIATLSLDHKVSLSVESPFLDQS